jgi:hypothetical protein
MSLTTRSSVVAFALLVIPWLSSAQDRGAAGTVTLPRTEYDRLLDLSSRTPAAAERPPVAAALTRADIRVRVDGAMARGTIAVEGEVFQTGPVKVPLLAGATLVDARSAGAPLPLTTDQNTLATVLTGPRPFAMTLEWAAPLTFSPGWAAVTLPVPAAGTSIARIEIPGERSDVRLAPGVILRRETTGGVTVLEVSLTPGAPAQLSWSAREASPVASPTRDLRMIAEVKTLVTIGESDLRLASWIDLTVVHGEPAAIEVRTPAGYELVNAGGATLDRSEEMAGGVRLVVNNPSDRHHRFQLTFTRNQSGSSFTLDAGFPTVPAAGRETGEVGVEGIGAIDVSGPEIPGLRRIDVRELDRQLAAASHDALIRGYRYQRSGDAPPSLTLDVTRYPDAPVLAAVAEHAIATTLVTSEGRALTEISLWIRNRAQPFARVWLPPGASMLSVDVAGEPAKPVEGADGTRVPLLRPGFRPDGAYAVSFVYLHAGTAFVRKGEMQMVLPRMDVPISLVQWELFVPDQYKADRFDGNVLPVNFFDSGQAYGGDSRPRAAGAAKAVPTPAAPGSIAGVAIDQTGSPIPGVQVIASGGGRTVAATTDAEGRYVLAGLPSGPIRLRSQITGFKTVQRLLIFDGSPQHVDFTMPIGALTETVTVSGLNETVAPERRSEQEPSANVQSLQRRVSGVLPVRIEVPRAGASYTFAKPLMIDEEAVVKFRYRRK